MRMELRRWGSRSECRRGGPDLRHHLLSARLVKSSRATALPKEAHTAAMMHLSWYRRRRRRQATFSSSAVQAILIGRRRRVNSRQSCCSKAPTRCGRPNDVPGFVSAGIRIVGLAWKRTRYAGGTGAPGPLTSEGRAIVEELDRFRIIHDLSHLAEESFWNLLDLTSGPVMASHSNCRAIVPTDRQLSDEMIRAATRTGRCDRHQLL